MHANSPYLASRENILMYWNDYRSAAVGETIENVPICLDLQIRIRRLRIHYSGHFLTESKIIEVSTRVFDPIINTRFFRSALSIRLRIWTP
jgi:hypothetical protein